MEVKNSVGPNAEQIAGFMEPGPSGPIYMVNLLKFKQRAEYADGRETDLTGAEAYQIYIDAVTKLLVEFGGAGMFVAPVERLALGGGDPLLAANGGLAGQPVVGVFALTLGPDGPRASTLIASVRAALPELRSDDRFSITSLRELLVCRYLGPRANSARRCFERAWSVLRPALLDAEAQAPRVWAT